jgi:hypothetical protein
MWFMLAMMAVQAFAQHKAAKAQEAEAEFQRKEALANAEQAAADEKLSEQIAEAEGVEAVLAGEQAEARARVGMAARGGRLDVGTNFLLSLQNAAMTEWEVFKTNLGGRRRTERFGAESLAFLREASQLEVRKANIRQAGKLAVATTVLGGLGQASMMRGSGSSPSFARSQGASGVGASGSAGPLR